MDKTFTFNELISSALYKEDIKKLGKDKSIFYCSINVEPYSKSNFLKFSRGRTYQPENMKEKDRIVAAECGKVMGQHGIEKYVGPLFMQIDGYFSTKRVFDAPNLSKSICDALIDVVYYDDRQIICCVCTKSYDKNNPRVEIYIKEFSEHHDMVNIKNLNPDEAEPKKPKTPKPPKPPKIKKTAKRVSRVKKKQ